jgi:hypothetical protein
MEATALHKKRDDIQVIGEIFGFCRSPQTKSCTSHQTSISYDQLQNCIILLLQKHWLMVVETDCVLKKFKITEKD